MAPIRTPSSTSQNRSPPYTRVRQRSHRPLPTPAYFPRSSKRNFSAIETLAHRFSCHWLSGIGKDNMLSEVEYMLIVSAGPVGAAHIPSADPTEDVWQSVHLDEQRRLLIYSGTLHLALAALRFHEDVEDMVKEARRRFSGLPQTVVRLWHAELVTHISQSFGDSQKEEDGVDPSASMENTDSHDLPPLHPASNEHASTSSLPTPSVPASSSTSTLPPPLDSDVDQQDASSFSRDSPRKRPAVRWMPLEDLAEKVVSTYVRDNHEALTSDQHPDYLMSDAEYETRHAAVCAEHPEMPTDGPLYYKDRRLVHRNIAPQALTVLECRDDLGEMLVEAETKFIGLPEKLVEEWQACVSRVNVRRVTRPREKRISTGDDVTCAEDTVVGSASDSSISSSSTLAADTLVDIHQEDTDKKAPGEELNGGGVAVDRHVPAGMLLMRGFRLLRRLPFAWMHI